MEYNGSDIVSEDKGFSNRIGDNLNQVPQVSEGSRFNASGSIDNIRQSAIRAWDYSSGIVRRHPIQSLAVVLLGVGIFAFSKRNRMAVDVNY